MRESLLLRPRAPLQWRWRGHWRRGGTSPGSAGAERSGAAGRWAGARGAPRSAAVQGADREGRPVALSRVLTQAARPVTARGTDWSPPGLPPGKAACRAVLALHTHSSQVPGYFIGQPHRPTLTEYKKKRKKDRTNSENWKNVQRQRAWSLRVGDDRFLQVRLGFTGGVCAQQELLGCPAVPTPSSGHSL